MRTQSEARKPGDLLRQPGEASKQVVKLFAYGNLKPGELLYPAATLRATPDAVRGTLWNHPSQSEPLLTDLGKGTWVDGYILELPVAELRKIDLSELKSQYIRMPAVTQRGEEVTVYLWYKKVPPDARRIAKWTRQSTK